MQSRCRGSTSGPPALTVAGALLIKHWVPAVAHAQMFIRESGRYYPMELHYKVMTCHCYENAPSVVSFTSPLLMRLEAVPDTSNIDWGHPWCCFKLMNSSIFYLWIDMSMHRWRWFCLCDCNAGAVSNLSTWKSFDRDELLCWVWIKIRVSGKSAQMRTRQPSKHSSHGVISRGHCDKQSASVSPSSFVENG